MQKEKLISILSKLLACPTAPFREERVLAELEVLLGGVAGVSLRRDSFGNLLAAYQGAVDAPWVVFVAHTDHPAFVRDPETGEMTFLGGMGEGHLRSGAPTEGFGDARIWDLPAFHIDGDILHSRACDDLTGCAAMVLIALTLAETEAKVSCLFAFTRAEEVGFVGSYHLAMSGELPKGIRVISIENSAERPPAKMGAGPIIRVGDKMTVFDPEITAALEAAARAGAIEAQRCLMTGGTCEGSAFAAAGYPVGAMCVALGNYHNCGPDDRVMAEYISVTDLLGLARIGEQYVRSGSGGEDARRNLLQRLDKIALQHHKYDAGFKGLKST